MLVQKSKGNISWARWGCMADKQPGFLSREDNSPSLWCTQRIRLLRTQTTSYSKCRHCSVITGSSCEVGSHEYDISIKSKRNRWLTKSLVHGIPGSSELVCATSAFKFDSPQQDLTILLAIHDKKQRNFGHRGAKCVAFDEPIRHSWNTRMFGKRPTIICNTGSPKCLDRDFLSNLHGRYGVPWPPKIHL